MLHFVSHAVPSVLEVEVTFTIEGFRDWKHATGSRGILQCHASCYSHIQAVSSWHEFKQNKEHGTSIASRLDSARNEQIRQNRHYLRSVAEVILLCSRLEIFLQVITHLVIHLTKAIFVK